MSISGRTISRRGPTTRGVPATRRGPRNIGQGGGRRPPTALRRAAKFGGRLARQGARAANAANGAKNQAGGAVKRTAQDLKNAANTTKNLAQPAGATKSGANAAKNVANRVLGRGNNSKPQKPQSKTNKAAKQLAKKGARAAGNAFGPIGRGVAEAGIFLAEHKKAREILLIGSLTAAFLLVYFLAGGTGADNPPKNAVVISQPTNPLNVTVTCNPAQIPVGKTSVCTITVTDSQDTDDITVVATIYPFAQYVNNSASPQGTYDSKNKTVTWDTAKLKIQLSAPITQTFTLTVTKTQKIDAVPIVATVNAAPPAAGGDSCTATGSPDVEAKWQQVLQLGQQYGPLWITFLNDARSIAQQQDYPLAVIIGQGALESAHGTSNFAKTRNNFFGFDAYTDNPGAAKSYPNPAASILDYVNLIKKSYQQAYAARSDPVKMVELIKAGGYATDPNYVQEVTSIKEFQILEGVSLPCN